MLQCMVELLRYVFSGSDALFERCCESARQAEEGGGKLYSSDLHHKLSSQKWRHLIEYIVL